MKIYPFQAWRPRSSFVSQVACVPYDVINTREARLLAEGNPDSFLHVIRPEIDLDPSVDVHDDLVYETGGANLASLLGSDRMIQDSSDSVYVYRLVMHGREQTGVFTCVGVDDYDADRILKHEHTRPDKEDDRTRHIISQQAHAEPVMLIHQDNPAVDKLITALKLDEPIYDFTLSDGVRHTIWKTQDVQPWLEAFDSVPLFYVADGHHRCKAASRASAELDPHRRNPNAAYHRFPATVFAVSQMQILPYNRVRIDTSADTIAQIWDIFTVIETGNDVPKNKGEVCIYAGGVWKTIRLHSSEGGVNPVQELDAYRIQKQLFEPVFAISDPRTDQNIEFVGGIRGTAELCNRVDSGSASIAFSMYPTQVQELLDVSDAGLLMPPKSTWFEPKLRSGLLIHTF